MFDVSFFEFLTIGVVALVVIGPERLPEVARTIGNFIGRAQRYVNEVKAGVSREIQLEELRKLQSQLVDTAHTLEDSVRKEMTALETTFADPLHEAIADLQARVNEAESGSEVALTPETEPVPVAKVLCPSRIQDE